MKLYAKAALIGLLIGLGLVLAAIACLGPGGSADSLPSIDWVWYTI